MLYKIIKEKYSEQLLLGVNFVYRRAAAASWRGQLEVTHDTQLNGTNSSSGALLMFPTLDLNGVQSGFTCHRDKKVADLEASK